MSSEMNEWVGQAKANVDAIEQRIESICSNKEDYDQGKYRDFWANAKEISNMFKTLRPIPKEDQERLWGKFSQMCEETKLRQEQEREARRIQSGQKRVIIEGKIEEACILASGDIDNENLIKAKALLDEVIVWLKGSSSDVDHDLDIDENAVKLLREDKAGCWEKWREANDVIHQRRQEIWNANYECMKSDVEEALGIAENGDAHDALAKVKDIQTILQEVQLSRPQRQEIRSLLNEVWDKAISRINEIREEKKKKHEEWLGRIEGHIERWTSLIQKNEDVISRLEEQISKLEEEEANARTSEYAERVRSWIEEKQQKIEEIKETSRSLEEKVSSAKGKISS